MVTVLNCDINGFLEISENKSVFCFGSGRYFRKFIENHPQLSICGVIDNYQQKESIDVEDRTYKIYSVRNFCEVYKKDCVLVITLRLFEEVIDQLDAIEQLDGILCFFPFVVEDYFNIDDVQIHAMKEQLKKLSERTSENEQRIHRKEKGENYYQIWEYYERANIGGSKARLDIREILEEQGYEIRKIHCGCIDTPDTGLSVCRMEAEWENVYRSIEKNAVVLMQHPAPMETKLPEHILRRMKEEKNIRFIVMIHEVESLRKTYYSEYRRKEFDVMFSIGDVFIVHNEVMRKFFIEQGIEPERVVSLDIFDYLDKNLNTEKKFERSVTVAANLNLTKSPYLLQLKELKELTVHLYGPSYDESIADGAENIHYHGSLPTDIIPQKLDRGFGLIWDGDSIDTCSGGTGEYLKYNNPHKLSLYLSAGLPIIIWNQAAQAQFVLKYKVGLCVDSLKEISALLEKMNEEQYQGYMKEAEKISQKLKEGYYFKNALKKAEELLCRLYQ